MDQQVHTPKLLTIIAKEEQLRKTIDQGKFWELSDEDILRPVCDAFPQELERLQNAYSIKDAPPVPSKIRSPSQILYNADYDKINRTLVGVLALRCIHAGDYATFVSGQPLPVKMKRESFKWIQQIFTDGLHESADLYALVMSMVINDLRKDPNLVKVYHNKSSINIENINHDAILERAVDSVMVPCLSRLTAANQVDLLLGIKLGAEFNFGQLAQAENVPACLSSLTDMPGHSKAFEMRYMEQILDVVGAAGHIDHTCARKLIEPIFQAYKAAHEVTSNIINDKGSLRDGCNLVLLRRASLFRKKGFRALLRLLCMGGAADKELAELYFHAFNGLEAVTKKRCVDSLSLDGSLDKPAMQPTYMPARFARGVANAKTPEPSPTGRVLRGATKTAVDTKIRALQSLMRYLTRVLTVNKKPAPGVTVIERNVMATLKNIPGSEEFKANPNILNKVDNNYSTH